ncbi:hypothetical protein J7U46_14600 [Pelomonas sp. V22]|uniref:hypothetical protein n=1 Tax=Pelomonas sp. V22 TaxID=2822139 RepID=UPI0024A8F024|nr:hypothetical protein [Pelomonas sp. V22]MDI4634286.1 hypothetical protein [Pelomonas sp. V22]
MLKQTSVSLALLLALAGQAHAAPISNADVIKLLDAGMPEEVVLKAIASGEPKFNTSVDALILLKKKGATAAILSAVQGASAQAGTPARPAAAAAPAVAAKPAAAAGGINPEEVLVAVGGQESTMQYIIPTVRTAARALGFGGVATYATLQGRQAGRKLPSAGLEFIVSVPKNAQAAGYLTLANFAVRSNGTREVQMGGGYMSYSTGINKDRVVAIKSEPLADQSRAREGFVLHKISPERDLPAGEYALVLYTAEVRTAGFFAQAANSYFDFSVE